MRTIFLLTSGASLSITLCLSMSQDAKAETRSAWSLNGGAACQLSIPTSNTSAHPKATGFRNESTIDSIYVICPISSSVTPFGGSTFEDLIILLSSLDGASHNVTCTATVGYGKVPPRYSSQTISFHGSGFGGLEWDASKFGGTSGAAISGSGVSSVTCLLPPQVAVEHTEGVFNYEIGN